MEWIDKYLKSRAMFYKPLFIRNLRPKEMLDDEKVRLTARSIQRLVKICSKNNLPAAIHISVHSMATDLLQRGADGDSSGVLSHKNSHDSDYIVTDARLKEVHENFYR